MAEENDDNRAMIVCMLQSQLTTPVTGSVTRQCCRCGKKVWMSPTVYAQARQKTENIDCICFYCLSDDKELQKEAKVELPNKAVIKEVMENLDKIPKEPDPNLN